MQCILGCTSCREVVQAVQQEIEDRLMSLREDVQAAQQHITQQFAQHQVQLPVHTALHSAGNVVISNSVVTVPTVKTVRLVSLWHPALTGPQHGIGTALYRALLLHKLIWPNSKHAEDRMAVSSPIASFPTLLTIMLGFGLSVWYTSFSVRHVQQQHKLSCECHS